MQEAAIDKFMRFVARDSSGRFFLWSVRWGEAGYGCQIATLTPTEERTLYEWSTRLRKVPSSTRRLIPPSIADQAPVSGSFVDSENAMRFFAKNGDRELNRWARIMFREIEKSSPPT